jgi:hypothetical protein
MAKIDDIIKNQKSSKNLKSSYKPWEARFLSVDIHSDGSIQDDELIEKEIVSDEQNKSEDILQIEDLDDQDTIFYKKIVTGVQKSILIFMINQEKKKDEAFFYTKFIFIDELINFVKKDIATIRKSIQRLKVKKLLFIYEHKKGRNGYISYKIPIKFIDFIKDVV